MSNQVSKIEIRIHDRYWCVADAYKDGVHIAKINKYYDFDKDFLYIYGEHGDSGSGYRKGDLKQKIYIGDCEIVEVIDPPKEPYQKPAFDNDKFQARADGLLARIDNLRNAR